MTDAARRVCRLCGRSLGGRPRKTVWCDDRCRVEGWRLARILAGDSPLGYRSVAARLAGGREGAVARLLEAAGVSRREGQEAISALDAHASAAWLAGLAQRGLESFTALVLAVRSNPGETWDALLGTELLPDGEARAVLAALLPELGREPGPAAVDIANRLSRKALRVAERAEHVPAVPATVSDLGARTTLYMLALAFVLLDADDDGLAGA